jgi:hypothetical protein
LPRESENDQTLTHCRFCASKSSAKFKKRKSPSPLAHFGPSHSSRRALSSSVVSRRRVVCLFLRSHASAHRSSSWRAVATSRSSPLLYPQSRIGHFQFCVKSDEKRRIRWRTITATCRPCRRTTRPSTTTTRCVPPPHQSAPPGIPRETSTTMLPPQRKFIRIIFQLAPKPFRVRIIAILTKHAHCTCAA